jgi:tRNA/tmRNA/rRNA uracil-C5-methylase (TrmA/RlmC/RlmD family)
VVDVSTQIRSLPTPAEIDRLHELRRFLHGVDDAPYLLQPEQLTMRLNLLDELDAIMGDLGSQDLKIFSDSEPIQLAASLRLQFEAANRTMFEAAHAEIALQGSSPAFDQWLAQLVNDRKTERPRPGLGFDLLDEIVCEALQFRGPGEAGVLPSPEMTAYQPTPVRHILDLIATCDFSSNDVLVDLGSGLGHVPLLVCMLAKIRTLGIEVQPEYAASAQETAYHLNLSPIQFLAEDARTADLSSGAVFYMFTPFTGSILTDVLHRLHRQSKTRQIRICSLGPCTHILRSQTWLTANQTSDTENIAIFSSL